MIDQAMRERVRAEVQRQGRRMKELSLAAGLGESYVRDMLDRGRGKFENLVLIAAQLGHPPEWLFGESPPGPAAPVAPSAERRAKGGQRSITVTPPNAGAILPAPTYGEPIPVLGVARGGEDGSLIFNGEVIETIPRPPELEGIDDAYSSYILGDSMYPRFKEGDRVWVHPRRPPRRGDDVIVQIAPDEENGPPLGFVKEFVGYSGGTLVLKQFNPMLEIKFAKSDVVSVHVIVGSLFR